MGHIHFAIVRNNVSYYPQMIVMRIMLKWNIIQMASGEKRLPPPAICKHTISKMRFELVDGVLQSKQGGAGTKCLRHSGVQTCGTSGGVAAGGTSGGAEGGAGGDDGVQREFEEIPQWLGDYTFDDIPPRTSGSSRSSIEAQLVEIRQLQLELRQSMLI
ncbi:hypothetical protein LIER_14144 [Lithospermum erythrorhizon]|uniref:Uncharacterized protein n=1 Tax=Lithospermum erythrorhizon TaxID=34254 RepID=A0AAV3PY63_LITER